MHSSGTGSAKHQKEKEKDQSGKTQNYLNTSGNYRRFLQLAVKEVRKRDTGAVGRSLFYHIAFRIVRTS